MTTATMEAVKLTERINRIEPSATMAVVAEADKLRTQGLVCPLAPDLCPSSRV